MRDDFLLLCASVFVEVIFEEVIMVRLSPVKEEIPVNMFFVGLGLSGSHEGQKASGHEVNEPQGYTAGQNLGVYGVYTLLILLKALDTIGNYSKQLLEYKFLGNEHWRQLCWYSHKHCEKRLPLNLLFFSHSNLSNRGVFSLHYSLALFL